VAEVRVKIHKLIIDCEDDDIVGDGRDAAATACRAS
jgi:hypothetical protein